MKAYQIRTLAIMCLLAGLLALPGPGTTEGRTSGPGQGSLTVIEPDGSSGEGCPLEHTSVNVEISGFVARVEVKQIFHNPRKEKIEAVYTFPLSTDAAVDDMVMRVGDRTVRGEIKRREEARRIYREAREQGRVASLLDQERPNIFTQSVANIMPGEKVIITIQYAEMLPYEAGAFTFAFPMVVGPRFIPGQATGRQGTGWANDSRDVPDASRITPPVTPEGTRAGHDIDVTVSLDAGVPLSGIVSRLHQIEIERKGKTRAVVSLKNRKEIPNRDFVLNYSVAGDQVRSGVLTHKDGKTGYATLIMIPPKKVAAESIAPREMIFVIDCSGSQAGKPLQKAKETMRYVLERMTPEDTFNIIDFNSGARALFAQPKKNSPETRSKALRYLGALQARGGTWMGPAIETVCKTPAPENRLRIVTFMTDGYVGNDFEIISLVKRLRGKSRWFPFGTGNSVNRFLLDTMANVGGGEVEYILLNSPGEDVAKKFYERIAEPVLTDITLTAEGVDLEEVFPAQVSDLWSRKPLIFKARYTEAGKGKVILKGFAAGKPYEQHLDVDLPEKQQANAAIASMWARSKVDDLMQQDWLGMQRGRPKGNIREEIVKVALSHRILTQFTSFVAVEETIVTVGGKPTRIAVPVEMPDGVSRKGVFGEQQNTVRKPALKGTLASGFSTQGTAPRPGLGKLKQRQPASMRQRSFVAMDAMKQTEEAAPKECESKAEGALDEETRSKESPEAKSSRLRAKLSQDLQKLIERFKESGKPRELTVGNLRISAGRVTVQVLLTGSMEGIVEKLKEAGLDIQFKATAGRTVIGTIAVEDLDKLVSIPQVRGVTAVQTAKEGDSTVNTDSGTLRH